MDYYKDIKNNYGVVMMGAYEKARMWPLEGANKGLDILDEEMDEVREAYISLLSAYMDFFNNTSSSREKFAKNPRFACETIEGYAMSTILELLQVISVCRKYVDVFEKEADREEQRHYALDEDENDG